MYLWFDGSQCVPIRLFYGLMTDLACRGLAAEAMSSGVQRWPGVAGCWGGKPGSSRRACSPARTSQDTHTLSFLLNISRCHKFLNENLSFVVVIRAAGCSVSSHVKGSWGELTWICCWSRLILCCCCISCCCCLAIWDTGKTRSLPRASRLYVADSVTMIWTSFKN